MMILKFAGSNKFQADLSPAPASWQFKQIMKQFDVPVFYRSPLISKIKASRKAGDKLKKDLSPTTLDCGGVRFHLARHFGFCYGVENAIEIAYRCIEENKGMRRMFLLSEMIHNPQVNADLQSHGIRFLQDSYGKELISLDELTPDDIVIIPAFGSTTYMDEQLMQRGIQPERYNTTCPFVEKVWNRGEQLAAQGYSLVIHGKPKHEETRATFSRTGSHTAAVIVNDMQEAETLSAIISGDADPNLFYTHFKGRFTEGFNPAEDLKYIGVINQTTQLASDTQAIADYLKEVVETKFGVLDNEGKKHFADTRDTLCYATNDNQTAVRAMLKTPADFAVVVGGYNSSNTSHLVELCEEVLPTFYIHSAECMHSDVIHHFNWRTKEELETANWLPANRPLDVLLTSGASCPDALVEGVMQKLIDLSGGAPELLAVSASRF